MNEKLLLKNEKNDRPSILGNMLLRLLILRLLIPTLVLILLTLGLAGYLWNRSLGAQQMELAGSLAHTTAIFLQNAEKILRSAASIAEMAGEEDFFFYLKSTRDGFSYFDTLYRLDKRGVIVMLAPLDSRFMGLDQSGQAFFKQVQEQGDFVISPPFNSIHTGKPTIFMVALLEDDGMLVGELNLGALQDAVTATRHEYGRSTVFIVDNSGTLLAHPQKKLVARQTRFGHLPIVQTAHSSEVTTLYQDENQWWLGSGIPIREPGWIVVVQAPVSVVYGPLLWVAIPTLAFCLGGWVLLALNFRQRFRQHIVSPLAELSQTATAISEGDLERTVPIESKDEIGFVAEAFNSMTAKLRHRIEMEKQLTAMSRNFIALSADEIEKAIEPALEKIGLFFDIDRCYIFQFSDDGKMMDCTFEWCGKHIESHKNSLQALPTDAIPWFQERIKKHASVQVPSISKLPPEATAEKVLWQKNGIQSLFCIPMVYGNTLRGFLGFTSIRQERCWSTEDIQPLCLAAEVICNTLERRHTQKELQNALACSEEARDNINAVLKSVVDGLILCDPYGRITRMNPAAEQLIGIPLSQIIEQPIDQVITASLPGCCNIPSLIQDETNAPFDLEWPGHPGKTPTILQAKKSPVLDQSGDKIGTIIILRDVTRERELDQMKNEFISTAAHELRTPLTSVKGYSDLLLSGQCFDVEQQTEFLSIINERAGVLEKIIDDLLNLSRVESGRIIHIEKKRCKIGSVIERIVQNAKMECKSRCLTMTLPSETHEIMADRDKIVQVMDNLLTNSIKFSGEGSSIKVDCTLSDDEFRIAVRDEGIGMTSEQMNRVFDKFYRADSSSTAQQGLGLGMSIVKNIIEAHDGRIWVESELGKGTIVTFTLPLNA